MPEWKEEIRQRLANLNLEPAREAEIVEELSQHLDDRYAELLSGGATPTEAERLTLAEFRESELLAQELRGVEREVPQDPIVLGANRRSNMIADLWQDLRYGARMLRKRPGFALTVVITLGLGIGANTTIFSLLNSLLLTRLPGIAEPDRVVQIGQTNNGQGFNPSSYADYRDYRDQASTLAGIAAESEQQFHLGTDTTAERVKGALVSNNYFDVLGVRSAQGRLLRPSDTDAEGANPVAVISERLRRKHFGAEPDVIGKTISLNSYPYTVIGVAAEFKGTSFAKTDIWIPVTMWRRGDPSRAPTEPDLLDNRSSAFVELFGRLKPGVTKEQSQADLSAIAERLGQAYPQKEAKFRNVRRGARVTALLGMSLRDRNELQQFFGLQFGIMVIVLLIACANVAGLALARAAGRQKEISVRLALGAGRWRVVRQLLTESAMMALLGGLVALLIAFWLTESFRAALPDDERSIKAYIVFAPDWRVLSFTLGLSVVTGLLFGLAPALQSSKLNLIPLLKDAGDSFSLGRGARLRSVLVIAQIALSLVLLVSAGLCVRTLLNARAINIGFATENLLTAKLNLALQHYSEAQGRAFYQQLLERAEHLPGVQAASLALAVPLDRRSYRARVGIEGRKDFILLYNIVTPNYLDTMGIPLLLGRRFTEQDSAASPRVAIINETFARQAWPNEGPVGKYFTWRDRAGAEPIEVIGVARDVKGDDLFHDTPPAAYLPVAQKYDGGMALHLRTATKPELLLGAVQQEIRALDPKLPIYNVKTLDQYRRDELLEKRIQAGLIGGFGLLALALASLGLFGVLSYSVAQRTQEIGIRMALGAQTGDVLRLIVGQGVKLIVIGLALGLAGALVATRVLKSSLFGVSATDPLTFSGIALLLTCVALLACWVPARRATQVDPLVALRCE